MCAMTETKIKNRFVSGLERDPKQRRVERGQILPFLNRLYKTGMCLASCPGCIAAFLYRSFLFNGMGQPAPKTSLPTARQSHHRPMQTFPCTYAWSIACLKGCAAGQAEQSIADFARINDSYTRCTASLLILKGFKRVVDL